jgi:hypothetical protein
MIGYILTEWVNFGGLQTNYLTHVHSCMPIKIPFDIYSFAYLFVCHNQEHHHQEINPLKR